MNRLLKHGVYPCVVPSFILDKNYNALADDFSGISVTAGADWGINNLLAYGSNSLVIIVDPIACMVVGSLDYHTCRVTCVRWNDKDHDIIASGDCNSNVVVWSVSTCTPLFTFHLPRKVQISTMAWVSPPQDFTLAHTKQHTPYNSSTHLLTLSPPNLLVMWNAAAQTQIWRKEIPDNIVNFELDPFEPSNVLLFANSGWLWYIRDLSSTCSPQRLDRYMKFTDKTAPTAEGQTFETPLRDVLFTRMAPNQVYIVYRREIALVDLDLQLTISSFQLPPNRADIRKLYVYPSQSQKRLFATLHADATQVVWIHDNESVPAAEGAMQLRALSTELRYQRHQHGARPALVTWSALHPEITAVIANDGTVSVWKFDTQLYASGYHSNSPHAFAVVGLLRAPGALVTCMEVAPFDDTPLIALGLTNGMLIAYDLLTSEMVVQLEVYNSVSITKVHWTSSATLLCWTTKQIGSHNHENQVSVVDLTIGTVEEIRKMKHEGHPIRSLRVSTSLKYVIILAKEQQVELWDLQTKSLLQLVNYPTSHIGTLEWYPTKTETAAGSDERFMVIGTDGSYLFYKVRAGKVFSADSKNNKAFSTNYPMSCVTYKSGVLVVGYSTGLVSYWTTGRAKELPVATHKAAIHMIKVCPPEYAASLEFNPDLSPIQPPTETPKAATNNRKSLQKGETPTDLALGVDFEDDDDQPIPADSFAGSNSNTPDSIKPVDKKPKPHSYADLPASQRKGAAPPPRRCLILVLFAEGEFGVWDLFNHQRISFSLGRERERDFYAVDVDWVEGPHPVVATTDGSILILDLHLGSCSTPVLLRSLPSPMSTPVFMPKPHSAYLRSLLMSDLYDEKEAAQEELQLEGPPSLCLEESSKPPPFRNGVGVTILPNTTRLCQEIRQHFTMLPAAVRTKLRRMSQHRDHEEPETGYQNNIAGRCLEVATFFGDIDIIKLWSTFIYYMKRIEKDGKELFEPSTPDVKLGSPPTPRTRQSSQGTTGLASPMSFGTAFGTSLSASSVTHAGLPTSQIDLPLDDSPLYPNDVTLNRMKEQVKYTDEAVSISSKTDLFGQIAISQSLCGNNDRAIQLLLSTPAEQGDFHANVYKACVLAAGLSPQNFQNTVKTVSSMLIAKGEIRQSVELLCVIGKDFEACKALQAHDRWEEAARLARTRLCKHDCDVILHRWVQHLVATDEVIQAVCVLISMADFKGALATLLISGDTNAELCALLSLSCEFQYKYLLTWDADLRSLVQLSYSQYADFLRQIGNTRLANRFTDLSKKGSPQGATDAMSLQELLAKAAASVRSPSNSFGQLMAEVSAITGHRKSLAKNTTVLETMKLNPVETAESQRTAKTITPATEGAQSNPTSPTSPLQVEDPNTPEQQSSDLMTDFLGSTSVEPTTGETQVSQQTTPSVYDLFGKPAEQPDQQSQAKGDVLDDLFAPPSLQPAAAPTKKQDDGLDSFFD